MDPLAHERARQATFRLDALSVQGDRLIGQGGRRMLLEGEVMKRQRPFSGLTDAHHGALVMCGRIRDAANDVAAQSELCEFVFQRFCAELVPHFQHEEEHVFPVLRGVHEVERQRALHEHLVISALAARIADGDRAALLRFGQLLAAHMRFEERELYPLYEALTAAGAEGAVAAEAPDVDADRSTTLSTSSGVATEFGSPVHVFDARGVARRVLNAAVFGALEVLLVGETLRLRCSEDPSALLAEVPERFGTCFLVQYVERRPGQVVVDLLRSGSAARPHASRLGDRSEN